MKNFKLLSGLCGAALAAFVYASPVQAESSCHGCSTVTTTVTTISTTDGNRANERIHAVQPGGSCNWENCKVESVMLKGSGPDPQTHLTTHTSRTEVCPPPKGNEQEASN